MASVGAAGATTPSSVRLISQTTTVQPSLDGTGRFSVAFTRPAGAGVATVSTRVFAPLSTRSGFLSAMSAAGPVGQIDQTAPIPLSCLPSVGTAHRLSVTILTGSAPRPEPRSCQGVSLVPTWTLHCTVGGGRCSGVYPVVLQVAVGSSSTSLTTFLTFAEAPAAQTLRVAPVLSLGAASTSAAVTDLAAAMRAAPGASAVITLAPTAATRLTATSDGRRALSELTSTASAPEHEVVRSPFVSIDPGALAASGLSAQIPTQVARGDRLLRRAGLHSVASAGWIATSPVTSTTATGLAAASIDRLVIPDASLSTPTSASLSWGEPFSPSGSPGITALAADSILSSQMNPGSDPVLAAERLLADLALLHLERPSLSSPLGVVLLAPSGWTPDRAFVSTLLQGLTANPLVSSATLTSLFAILHKGSNGVPPTRTLAASGPSAPWPAAQVGALASGQARVAALSEALSQGRHVIRRLSDGFLAAESDQLGAPGRTAAIGSANGAVDAELGHLGIGGSDITLTSLKGTLPITLTKTADWTMAGVLTVRSDHLRFPHGHIRLVTIDHPTQSVRIPVVAETTGDLTVSVTLTTPTGGLLLARQRIVVRTTQTSAAAIVLTIGAALVLVVWWVRTSLRRPRRRSRR